jgi:glycosyltransferase involved in cell wall biosynthesis
MQIQFSRIKYILFAMNICFVLGSFRMGGAERQALYLANRLRHKGNNLSFIGFIDGPLRLKLVNDDFPATFIDWSEITEKGHFNLLSKFFKRLQQIYCFLKYLHSNKIDILMPYTITPNVRCGLLYKFGGVRLCVWNQRDAGISFRNSVARQIAAWLTPVFISNSDEGKRYISATYKVSLSRIHVINNAIVPCFIVPGDKKVIRNKLGMDENAFIALMIANLTLHKDHPTLLKAWANYLNKRNTISSAQLLLAGNFENAYDEIVKLIEDHLLSETVRLLGFVDTVHDIIVASDICVFSSKEEGCPNGVLECMAAGLAVSGTDISAIRNIVAIENLPYLSPIGDYHSMSKSIFSLEINTIDRKSIGEANRKIIINRFNPDILVQQTCSVIDNNLRK